MISPTKEFLIWLQFEGGAPGPEVATGQRVLSGVIGAGFVFVVGPVESDPAPVPVPVALGSTFGVGFPAEAAESKFPKGCVKLTFEQFWKINPSPAPHIRTTAIFV